MADYIENLPPTVVKELRYTNDAGDLVSKLFPVDYILLIAKATGALIRADTRIDNKLVDHEERIKELEEQTIPDEYTTPEIDGKCLNGDQQEPIDTLLETFVDKWCDFRDITGNDTTLNNVISGQPIANDDPACAGGIMSGIPNWVDNPSTLSESFTNMWLAIKDLRTGAFQALSQSAVTCKDVVIDFAATITNNGQQVNLFLSGHSYIPAGFADTNSGSTVSIMDSLGNVFYTGIDITANSSVSEPVVFDVSASDLFFASDYIVTLNSDITNGTLTCSKSVVKTITNTTSLCPGVNTVVPSTNSVTITLTPYVKENTTYTVTLYAANGTTVIESQNSANPTTAFSKTFNNLSSSTAYKIGVTVTYLATEPVECTQVSFSTTS